MPITLPPPPWPPAATPADAWRFGVPVTTGPGLGDGPPTLRWLMRRNCSITPSQLMGVYLSLCVVSLAIAGMFFLQGAPYVLGFAGAELLALGWALMLYARHAADRETLTLRGRRLEVEQLDGGERSCAEFRAEWLVVEPSAGQGSLIELSGQGHSVRVGRFLRPELRAAFARELRLALRRARFMANAEPAASESKHA